MPRRGDVNHDRRRAVVIAASARPGLTITTTEVGDILGVSRSQANHLLAAMKAEHTLIYLGQAERRSAVGRQPGLWKVRTTESREFGWALLMRLMTGWARA